MISDMPRRGDQLWAPFASQSMVAHMVEWRCADGGGLSCHVTCAERSAERLVAFCVLSHMGYGGFRRPEDSSQGVPGEMYYAQWNALNDYISHTNGSQRAARGSNRESSLKRRTEKCRLAVAHS